ncbi:MAG: hypothetical protein HY558_01890 [Euryarchaeota archaeon]|nr:hypothetical protein [Euryarchaeota archaeon]
MRAVLPLIIVLLLGACSHGPQPTQNVAPSALIPVEIIQQSSKTEGSLSGYDTSLIAALLPKESASDRKVMYRNGSGVVYNVTVKYLVSKPLHKIQIIVNGTSRDITIDPQNESFYFTNTKPKVPTRSPYALFEFQDAYVTILPANASLGRDNLRPITTWDTDLLQIRVSFKHD